MNSLENITCQKSQNKQKQNLEKQISFLSLFRFSDRTDIIHILIGSFCSILIGAALPLFSSLWGQMTDSFSDLNTMVSTARTVMTMYLIFGGVSLFAGWGMHYFWQIAAEKQANKCRKALFSSLLRQEIGWFETQSSHQILTKFTRDAQSFQMAIGEKISIILYIISMFISGLVIALTKGWELSLVVISVLPLLAISWWWMIKIGQGRSQYEQGIFQKASAVAQESINGITIVKQFNGQQHEQMRFQQILKEIKNQSFVNNLKISLSQASSLMCLLSIFTLTFWFGSQCNQNTHLCPQKQDNPYSPGTVLIIFFSLVLPAVNLNQLAPSINVIYEGKIAAGRMFKIIDRETLIRNRTDPIFPTSVKGIINFQGIYFSYPKDKNRQILSNFNLDINCKHLGIMGISGSGKSTILQLLMRFYDPDQGRILLDGIDIRDLDLKWLRQKIGYVGQQPSLLGGSIRDSLLMAKDGAKEEEIMEALQQAEMMEFVMSSQEKLEIFVGVGGGQLSGGQKQRVAIARAILKDPLIFLFDQATSALDRKNQKLIQDTLRRILKEKISITVAHRVQTLDGCEEIAIIEKGKLLEKGSGKEVSYSMNQEQIVINERGNKKRLQKIPQKHKNNILILPQHPISIQNTSNLLHQSRKKYESPSKSDSTFCRLLSYAEGTFLIPLGIICALTNSLALPTMGLHIARVLSFSLQFDQNPQKYDDQIKFQSLIMLITSFIGPIAIFLQYFIFLYISNGMVNKIRSQIYKKILRMPLEWFQDQNNNPQQISIKLGADMIVVSAMITTFFPRIIVAISSITFGLSMAFYFQWRTALVSIVLIPLIGVSGAFQTSMSYGMMSKSQRLYEQSSKIVSQGLNYLKTIVSFCYEQKILEKYSQKLENIQNEQFRKKAVIGFLFGLSYLILFVAYGLIFFLSALFIRDNDLDITKAFSAVFLVLFSGIVAGNSAKSLPDMSILNVKAAKLFEILDLEDEEQLQQKMQTRNIKEGIKGRISFENVSFRYKNRSEVVLKNASFTVDIGQKIGIVGSSGCGKSTIIKLLMRFYERSSGQIKIDNIRIEDYDIHYLRSIFGAVSQQPQLFDESVQYNILYNQADLQSEKIVKTIRMAEIFSQFSDSLSQEEVSYLRRKVGPKGSHLSGGQKQRVAIARTILRTPTIFLLDQVTSALDKENSQKIQANLLQLTKGKTSLCITHKLQTLKNADKILVFNRGQICEEGSYDELIHKNMKFYALAAGKEI